jgi:hypothetical protein
MAFELLLLLHPTSLICDPHSVEYSIYSYIYYHQ